MSQPKDHKISSGNSSLSMSGTIFIILDHFFPHWIANSLNEKCPDISASEFSWRIDLSKFKIATNCVGLTQKKMHTTNLTQPYQKCSPLRHTSPDPILVHLQLGLELLQFYIIRAQRGFESRGENLKTHMNTYLNINTFKIKDTKGSWRDANRNFLYWILVL